jgi:hypothetical protein
MNAIMFGANVIDYRAPERAPCASLVPSGTPGGTAPRSARTSAFALSALGQDSRQDRRPVSQARHDTRVPIQEIRLRCSLLPYLAFRFRTLSLREAQRCSAAGEQIDHFAQAPLTLSVKHRGGLVRRAGVQDDIVR